MCLNHLHLVGLNHLNSLLVKISGNRDDKLLYILNAQQQVNLNSGKATTIFLRVIKTLKFRQSTSTNITNLLVQTVDYQEYKIKNESKNKRYRNIF
ncbi:MAG: hypothetical protein RLZZ507_4138 [Cyanobacteriota bacterium]|jgi:hypothetical protein